VAGMVGEIAFDYIRANDDHSSSIAQNSKNWKNQSCAGPMAGHFGEWDRRI